MKHHIIKSLLIILFLWKIKTEKFYNRMNKTLKKILIGIGIFALVIILANFLLNLLLNYYLPRYIKNNTDYKVDYQSLNVDLGTGDITATDFKISSLKTDNQSVIGLDGTLDTLHISRFGIYDAIFNKEINSSKVLLANPKLKVTLPKPKEENKDKKQPIEFDRIKITNGEITILKHTKELFLSVKDLNVSVTDFSLPKDTRKLPFTFQQYFINGKEFYFRPDEVYEMKSSKIETENGRLQIQNFSLKPLLTYGDFIKKFPKKRNLFDVETKEVDFKDIVYKDEKLTLSELRFEQPKVKMFTNDSKTEDKEQSFTYEVYLKDVIMNQANILILKPNGNKLFSAEELNMKLSQLAMDEQTAKGNIPFEYEKFNIEGEKLNYVSNTQDIKASTVALNQKSANLQNVSVKPIVSHSDKTLIDAQIPLISLKVNDWSLKQNKLKLDAESFYIEGLNASIISPKNQKNQPSKRNSFDKMQSPLLLRNLILEQSNLKFVQGDKVQKLNDLFVKVKNIEMNSQTIKEKIPFKTGVYSLTAKSFNTNLNRFNRLNTGLIKINNQNLQISNFVMEPSVSRSEFIRLTPERKDLYTVKIQKLTSQGNFDISEFGKEINVDQLTIDNVNANIFRSLIPKENKSYSAMYSEKLRKIKIPLLIKNVDIKNSYLAYEEDAENDNRPGKLHFTDMNVNIKNINSGKIQNTKIPINVTANFMGASGLSALWILDPANRADAFTMNGNLRDFAAKELNPFVQPYLNITTEGKIDNLIFNFNGNNDFITGTFKIEHQDLKVNILKDDGNKNKFLTGVANIFVKSDSKKNPEGVNIGNVERDKSASFFNLFWQGILAGLKKTLI